MIVRLILFGLFFYLIYFLLKYLFFRPFKDGYNGNPERNQARNPFRSKREGEVTITYNPEKDKKEDKKVGEYVDYEELKE